jgi:hypothetical protein
VLQPWSEKRRVDILKNRIWQRIMPVPQAATGGETEVKIFHYGPIAVLLRLSRGCADKNARPDIKKNESK